ncbi:MAG: Clp protease ClpP [Clostridia bacterium]|nr:Clp protease ClpP [Clostridia bacterium]
MKDKSKTYYSLYQKEDKAVLNIFGDITSFPWLEGDFSNVMLSKKLEEMKDVSVIDVYINSYGGEVAEGLAIYNALKRHSAKIITHIDGFACSIASVIFMAGDERIMPNTSCLMIHNPWIAIAGNANELRKQADDLDTIAECSISAYMEHINISENELKEMLDNESWISSKDAVKLGFATSIEDEDDSNKSSQSVKSKVVNILLNSNIKQEECNLVQLDQEKESEEELSTDKEVIDEIQEDNEQTDTDVGEQQEEQKEEKEVESPQEKVARYLGTFFNELEKEILK